MIWVEFLFCSALVVYCGTKLSLYGDVIAEKTGLGRAWIGLILMSGVISLPELSQFRCRRRGSRYRFG